MVPLFFAFLFLLSCSSTNSDIKAEISAPIPEESDPYVSLNYDSLKTAMEKKRTALAKAFLIDPAESLSAAQNYLYKTLFKELLPHWIGTDWDFNGITPKTQ